MKKLLFAGALAIAGLFSAQESKGLQGTWFVGGQLSFGSTKSDVAGSKAKTTSTTILPIVGNFISPSVAVGAGVGYMGDKVVNAAGTSTTKTTAIVIKPLVRKYWNVTGGLFFYGQAALPIILGKTEVTGVTTDVKTTDVALQLAPGFDYVINKWMTIETSFNILSVGFSSKKDVSNSFNFNANPFNSVSDRTMGDLQVGVKFLF